MANPFFLVIEGIDGSGKTTQANAVCKTLTREGRGCKLVCSVTSDTISTAIRERMAGKFHKHEASMALLYAADRVEMFRNEIEPALADGDVVICDRYFMSSYAYQSDDSSITLPWLEVINRHVPEPSARIILDIDPKVAMSRVVSRNSAKSSYEKEAFLAKARARYKGYSARCRQHVIDASRPTSMVTKAILSKMREWGAW